MISAKIGPISITTIRENGVEYIVDWFDQHKQSFYTLGWSYISNQQQMEELFYRSIIKIHKELPRFKSETSFETWVTSIFIHTCRELSDDRSLQASEESEPRQDLFKALDQLKEYEKEAVVLTYIKGISQEDTAHLLQVSVEKMKEHLFSGIQSLRKGMGYGSRFNGCKEYHKNYIDYLERTLDRSKKVDFEVHIYHCQNCQEDLAAFQDVMLKTIELDASRGYPQTFEYAGSTISIDKVEIGQPTNIVISNHEIENRAYESLQFNIVGEDENETSSMEMNSEGVLVDKNGIKYDMNENPGSYEEIEQPRYFFSVLNIGLQSNNAGEKVIPKRMEVYGYNTTKYLDDVVKISLE
ncbi:hypothetical protein BACCIP111895_04032 [Neobacillus rhizosphaerae]|uniref:RNA polymerase sigma factor 70 region 4 type 2 domain-containing protein n=1 Tax=Neobacillus rhizosphaerae TaxID=2880965 RepID=A0ABM9EVZ0_9BACI|nr:sigma-70 family RNA polymerase sigma factor [Neobacillus rhizosphaerae]CAH2716844.1 hypothetical protein BACCIP111895_04032 [Neobacillus rhizosphaerae]